MVELYRVRLVREASEMLRKIGKKFGKKTYEALRDLIQELEFNPEQKGEMLTGELYGLYSLHYSRFRVIYRIHDGAAEVVVLAAGWHESGSRKDIYRILERMVESGYLDIEDTAEED